MDQRQSNTREQARGAVARPLGTGRWYTAAPSLTVGLRVSYVLRQVAAGQSAAGPAHSKEAPLI